MDDINELLEDMRDEMTNLYEMVSDLTSEIHALQFAVITGLSAAHERFGAEVAPIITSIRDELLLCGRNLQKDDDEQEDLLDPAEACFELSARIQGINSALPSEGD